MFGIDSSSPTVTNRILWGNSSEILNTLNSTPAVSYTIAKDGYAGTGNLNVDTLFVNQSSIRLSTSGDLRLQTCSSAIDAGLDAVNMTPTGFDGNPRLFGYAIDLGAFETQTFYIDTIQVVQFEIFTYPCDGVAMVVMCGNTGLYSFEWSNGANTAIVLTIARPRVYTGYHRRSGPESPPGRYIVQFLCGRPRDQRTGCNGIREYGEICHRLDGHRLVCPHTSTNQEFTYRQEVIAVIYPECEVPDTIPNKIFPLSAFFRWINPCSCICG